MMLNYFQKKPRQFLLFLTLPTPNGRLHLGHIGGPFLKLDVIKRFNQQIGNRAFIYGGTDSYDSYVLLKAAQTGRTVNEVCHYFHSAIEQDINKMHIEMDYFFNPLDEIVSKLYFTNVQKINNTLLAKDKISVSTESYPYVESIGFLPPSFILGVCSLCTALVHSLICENCGSALKPEQIVNKSCKITHEKIQEKPNSVMSLSINKDLLLPKLSELNLSDDIMNLINDFLNKSESTRLTIPIGWGIPADNNSVYYTYGNFFTYLYTLSEIFMTNHQLDINPFHENSEIETVASSGFDNIIPFAITILNQATQFGCKGLNHYFPNYFMTLNGEKFSTSRKHAIWVKRIPKHLSIDILRLYLIKENSDKQQNDFNTLEFVKFYNETAAILNKQLFKKEFTEVAFNDASDLQLHFENILFDMHDNLMPENYCGHSVYKNISTWLTIETTNKESHNLWLRGFAVIAYAVMPIIVSLIWKTFEEDDIPKPEHCFVKKTFINNLIPLAPFPEISVNDICH